MLTFLEFYQTFLSFINFRLYTSINLVYPPKIDLQKDDAGAGLSAYFIRSITDQERPTTEQPTNAALPVKDTKKLLDTLSSKIASITEDSVTTESPPAEDEALDTFISTDPTADLPQPAASAVETTSSLFHGLHIYLSREAPVDDLTFILLSFGVSSLSTDPTSGPHPYPESDSRITHQVCDRGRLPDHIVPGRKYVQPQWVVDSINKGMLQDETLYVLGAELPAHLSPFVEKAEGKYDPEAPLDVGSDEDVEEEEIVEDSDTEHQRGLLAEAAGENVIEKGKRKKRKEVDEEKETKEMAKIMMSNKNRRLLEAIEYGNRKRRGETEKLQEKKRKLVREERKRKKAKLG